MGFVAEGAGQVPAGPDSNVRPCTGAILVLVFALMQGVFWASVPATFAMAIGTAITVAALATLALGSRELALRLGGRSGAFAHAVWTICSLGGSALIHLFARPCSPPRWDRHGRSE